MKTNDVIWNLIVESASRNKADADRAAERLLELDREARAKQAAERAAALERFKAMHPARRR